MTVEDDDTIKRSKVMDSVHEFACVPMLTTALAVRIWPPRTLARTLESLFHDVDSEADDPSRTFDVQSDVVSPPRVQATMTVISC